MGCCFACGDSKGGDAKAERGCFICRCCGALTVRRQKRRRQVRRPPNAWLNLKQKIRMP
jgi:hypothetical protein